VHLIRHSLAHASWKERKGAGGGAEGDLPGTDGGYGGERAGRLRGGSVGREVAGVLARREDRVRDPLRRALAMVAP